MRKHAPAYALLLISTAIVTESSSTHWFKATPSRTDTQNSFIKYLTVAGAVAALGHALYCYRKNKLWLAQKHRPYTPAYPVTIETQRGKNSNAPLGIININRTCSISACLQLLQALLPVTNSYPSPHSSNTELGAYTKAARAFHVYSLWATEDDISLRKYGNNVISVLDSHILSIPQPRAGNRTAAVLHDAFIEELLEILKKDGQFPLSTNTFPEYHLCKTLNKKLPATFSFTFTGNPYPKDYFNNHAGWKYHMENFDKYIDIDNDALILKHTSNRPYKTTRYEPNMHKEQIAHKIVIRAQISEASIASFQKVLLASIFQHQLMSQEGRIPQRITSLPKILTIMNLAFVPLIFTERLDMAPFTSVLKDTKYRLIACSYGAAIHVSPRQVIGHAIAYIRHNNKWYLCDDSEVFHHPARMDCYRRVHRTTDKNMDETIKAYAEACSQKTNIWYIPTLLFYERIDEPARPMEGERL